MVSFHSICLLQYFMLVHLDHTACQLAQNYLYQLSKTFSCDLQLITENRDSLLEPALLERCDGNRNILHACVSRSYPVSAHELGEAAESQLNKGTVTTNGALGNKLESIKGAVDALAAAVAAAAAAVRSSGKSFNLLCSHSCHEFFPKLCSTCLGYNKICEICEISSVL